MMIVDFSNLTAKDLNGAEYIITDICKNLGNSLYMDSMTIEQEDFARLVHKGEPFDLDEKNKIMLIEYLGKKSIFTRWVQNSIIDLIKNIN